MTVPREYVPDESLRRVYMTNVDCSNKEGVKRALRAYRRRWPIKELFRFARQEFGLEGFDVRSLRAINKFCILRAKVATVAETSGHSALVFGQA